MANTRQRNGRRAIVSNLCLRRRRQDSVTRSDEPSLSRNIVQLEGVGGNDRAHLCTAERVHDPQEWEGAAVGGVGEGLILTCNPWLRRKDIRWRIIRRTTSQHV